MKQKHAFLIVLLLLISNFIFSQNTYDIVFPGNDRNMACHECLQVFNQKPKEVRFGIERENNKLYFRVDDKEWFYQLIKNPNDGIAIDIVVKDRYSCEYESVKEAQIRGLLQKPVYSKELKSGLESIGDNLFRVFVGQVPEAFINDELEYNILFLSNKNLCNYYWVYNLESYPWDLLDMGMFLDSLTYNTKEIKPSGSEGYVIKNKTLKFQIPFEKNKATYSQEDIKPIYDSLRLTDFNIKTIKIKAYSSVEGSLDRNIELQEQRAKSIINALQAFQKPTIETHVSSSENWVEFLNDIKGTAYSNLANLTKAKIKERLVGTLSKEIEPILMKHRKAMIELELEKKDRYKDLDVNELLDKFNQSVKVEKMDEVIEIQNSIFEKMKSKEVSPEILRKMEVPKQTKFIKIFNKNSAFRYMQNERQALIVYNELLDLEKLVPKDGEVKYNIVALKIKLWYHNAIEIDEKALKNEIHALKNYGIDNMLISRMLVNFHITKAKNFMQKRDYANKDKSVAFINANYSKFPLSDYDCLSLAQFFSHYANTDLAVNLLEIKAKSIDIDENLLFYYLNLTLIDRKFTSNSEYRTIMLNAINMNKPRFCKLFNATENGGVTFQMLEDEYLRKTYCENCNN